MARPKKSEEPAKSSASLQVSIEDFVRTRDSVVTGLATLQSAVQDLSRAYIAHTNTVIGKGTGSSLELLNLANPLGSENGLFSGRLATPAPATEQGEVKKRKRAPHDKNAPKRPVTPYFLYMQYAREGIAKDMAEGSTAKMVADEGTKRWNSMGPMEKEKWAELYAENYAAYRKKVEAYKAGLPIPEFTQDQAKELAEQQKKAGAVPDPPQHPPSDNEGRLDSDDTDVTSSDEESPEPPKAASPPKSPRASKRGKNAKERADKKSAPVKQPLPAPTASAAAESSSKLPDVEKRKKVSKKKEVKGAESVAEAKKDAQAEAGASPSKSKKDSEPKLKRRKRKSEGVDV